MSTSNFLLEKMIIFSLISDRLVLCIYSELAVVGAFCRCAMAEKLITQHIFSLYFLTPKM